VGTQIKVLTKCYDKYNDPERKAKYKKVLECLEDKLDVLLMS